MVSFLEFAELQPTASVTTHWWRPFGPVTVNSSSKARTDNRPGWSCLLEASLVNIPASWLSSKAVATIIVRATKRLL